MQMNDNNENKRGINDPDLIIKKDVSKKKCPNCKEMVEYREMCSNCNHYMGEGRRAAYQPMSRKTRWIIKLVLTGVLTIVAVILLWDNITACAN
ncbi:MAG: hypothetical protein FWE03_05840 [Firmicutes bacterium]|nr:hypothetical protein [Bacillota bacterium]